MQGPYNKGVPYVEWAFLLTEYRMRIPVLLRTQNQQILKNYWSLIIIKLLVINAQYELNS